jgi:hypothetical protein
MLFVFAMSLLPEQGRMIKQCKGMGVKISEVFKG